MARSRRWAWWRFPPRSRWDRSRRPSRRKASRFARAAGHWSGHFSASPTIFCGGWKRRRRSERGRSRRIDRERRPIAGRPRCRLFDRLGRHKAAQGGKGGRSLDMMRTILLQRFWRGLIAFAAIVVLANAAARAENLDQGKSGAKL